MLSRPYFVREMIFRTGVTPAIIRCPVYRGVGTPTLPTLRVHGRATRRGGGGGGQDRIGGRDRGAGAVLTRPVAGTIFIYLFYSYRGTGPSFSTRGKHTGPYNITGVCDDWPGNKLLFYRRGPSRTVLFACRRHAEPDHAFPPRPGTLKPRKRFYGR